MEGRTSQSGRDLGRLVRVSLTDRQAELTVAIVLTVSRLIWRRGVIENIARCAYDALRYSDAGCLKGQKPIRLL